MEPTEQIDPQCISRVPHAKSMSSVDGHVQRERGVNGQESEDREL